MDEENPISGLTPFMLAALKNLQMIAKYLYFKCKANINYKNQFEETCMHIAKRKGMQKEFAFLQSLGCKMTSPVKKEPNTLDMLKSASEQTKKIEKQVVQSSPTNKEITYTESNVLKLPVLKKKHFI